MNSISSLVQIGASFLEENLNLTQETTKTQPETVSNLASNTKNDISLKNNLQNCNIKIGQQNNNNLQHEPKKNENDIAINSKITNDSLKQSLEHFHTSFERGNYKQAADIIGQLLLVAHQDHSAPHLQPLQMQCVELLEPSLPLIFTKGSEFLKKYNFRLDPHGASSVVRHFELNCLNLLFAQAYDLCQSQQAWEICAAIYILKFEWFQLSPLDWENTYNILLKCEELFFTPVIENPLNPYQTFLVNVLCNLRDEERPWPAKFSPIIQEKAVLHLLAKRDWSTMGALFFGNTDFFQNSSQMFQYLSRTPSSVYPILAIFFFELLKNFSVDQILSKKRKLHLQLRSTGTSTEVETGETKKTKRAKDEPLLLLRHCWVVLTTTNIHPAFLEFAEHTQLFSWDIVQLALSDILLSQENFSEALNWNQRLLATCASFLDTPATARLDLKVVTRGLCHQLKNFQILENYTTFVQIQAAASKIRLPQQIYVGVCELLSILSDFMVQGSSHNFLTGTGQEKPLDSFAVMSWEFLTFCTLDLLTQALFQIHDYGAMLVFIQFQFFGFEDIWNNFVSQCLTNHEPLKPPSNNPINNIKTENNNSHNNNIHNNKTDSTNSHNDGHKPLASQIKDSQKQDQITNRSAVLVPNMQDLWEYFFNPHFLEELSYLANSKGLTFGMPNPTFQQSLKRRLLRAQVKPESLIKQFCQQKIHQYQRTKQQDIVDK